MYNHFIRILVIWSIVGASHIVIADTDESPENKGHKRPSFSSLDLDGNGAVTLAEFKQHKIPRGKHDKVFSRIDSNDDQSISEQEFTDHKPPCHKKGERPRKD